MSKNAIFKLRIIALTAVVIIISGWLQLLLADDPPSLKEYGHILFEDSRCTVWWAPSTYKIPQDGGVPSRKSPVKIKAARNEAEAFQLVVHPKERMDHFRVEVSNLKGPAGNTIGAQNIRTYEEVYVHVRKPTDKYAEPGYYPDPLPRLDGPLNLPPSENQPIWIRVDIPDDAVAGNYRGTIKLSSGDWNKNIPFQLEVWDFTLPEKTHLRSAFGVGTEFIKKYHNLETQKELRKVTGKYYQALAEQRLSPSNPFSLYPIKVRVNGKQWTGGEIVKDNPFRGKYALKLDDESRSKNVEAQTLHSISVHPDSSYFLSWRARTKNKEQQYTVLVQGYNAEGEYLPYQNVLEVYPGSKTWTADTLHIGSFLPEVDRVTVHLFGTYRDYQGSKKGITWFDELTFAAEQSGYNRLKSPGFELNPAQMSVQLDFSAFDQAGRRYLDSLGFNAFRLNLKGVGSGTYYSHQKGRFGGFIQSTKGYDKLFGNYIKQVQDHLEKKGWLDEAYVYWFDEPNRDDYSFVQAGMKNIHQFAPKLTRLITEHAPGPEISDVTEISCTIVNRLNREKIIQQVKQGQEYWSYLCTSPKAPYINEFIDHKAINLRIWPWLSWKYQLTGILMWQTTYWNSSAASPRGQLQNPWENPMSYVKGYGWPYGKVTGWGNGDGRYFYPPDRNAPASNEKDLRAPVISIRLEYLREGMEDYEYFWMLEQAVETASANQQALVNEAKELLKIPDKILQDTKNYTKNPELLVDHREKIAELLVKFNK